MERKKSSDDYLGMDLVDFVDQIVTPQNLERQTTFWDGGRHV